MSYEMFELGPEVWVTILLINLLITLLAYGIFPILFALLTKSIISKGKYRLICYIVNAVVTVAFIALNSSSGNAVTVNGAPYLLWTSIFAFIGIKILDKRCNLIG